MEADQQRYIRIETADYLLQTLRADNVCAELNGWVRDPKLLHFLSIEPMFLSMGKFRKWVAEGMGEDNFWVGIFSRSTRKLVGVYMINIVPFHRLANVSILIGDRDYWGRRVPSETVDYLVSALFDRCGIEKVVASIATKNKRMIISFVGWKPFFETVLRGELLDDQGRGVDIMRFLWLKYAVPGEPGYLDWRRHLRLAKNGSSGAE